MSKEKEDPTHGKVMVVDDDPFVLESTVRILQEFDFIVEAYSDGFEALKRLQEERVDVLLSDIKMPKITGIELLQRVRAIDQELPVILVTGYAEVDSAIAAVQQGAFDFILKPYDPLQLVNALEKAVKINRLNLLEKNYKAELEQTVAQRTQDLNQALKSLEDMSREVIVRLAAAAELRDDDTGRHNSRIGSFAKILAEAMGMPDHFQNTIALASTMHDIGKIGIPDSILHKSGSLSAEEFQIVTSHTIIGHQLLDGSPHALLQMAARIALTHHERWDGTGYPKGLRGEEIPIEGRIVILADQYDALRNRRVYKPAFSHEKTCLILTEGDGRTLPGHFDPKVLQAFKQVAPIMDNIFNTLEDAFGMPLAGSN